MSQEQSPPLLPLPTGQNSCYHSQFSSIASHHVDTDAEVGANGLLIGDNSVYTIWALKPLQRSLAAAQRS